MDYEKALEILIELMIENKDVLLRLKEGEPKQDEQLQALFKNQRP